MKDRLYLVLCKFSFALILLFIIYGCKTTDNTVTAEPSASTPQTDSAQTVSDNKQAEMFRKRLGDMFGGHGGIHTDILEKKTGTTEAPEEDITAKTNKTENRPFIELEKKIYGQWTNRIETESYDFHDDGTVLIVVSGPRGKTLTLNGNYLIVEEGRIKIDFRGDSFVRNMPPRYFKLFISENEFTLTDEPKEKDGPDGSTTKYTRVK